MRSYKKPDNTLTRDVEDYAKAWSKFADEVAEMFPGYVPYGFDPGVVFRPINPGRHDTFSLPTGACNALLKYKAGKK